MTSTAAGESRNGEENPSLGHASLSEDEKEILNWSRERRLEEFQKIKHEIDVQVLANQLFYIDTLTVENGEILDILKLNPRLSWEKVRDVFLGGPVDGYTSTFHGLEGINYPEHFWKALVENERERLISP
jgi:hypothetical protein